MAAANMKIVISKVCRPAEEGSSISGFQKQYEVSNTSIFSRLSFRYWIRSWWNEREEKLEGIKYSMNTLIDRSVTFLVLQIFPYLHRVPLF